MPLVHDRRVRDLVHGFVYLTKAECDVISHRLFQRLRHIRQNDIASLVYPSLNVTRFEHSLGCCHVAARIAAHLRSTKEWSRFGKALREKKNLNGDGFEQACRLYALLHDVGHLPFSHMFEIALEDFAASMNTKNRLKALCDTWFGPSSFNKPHEAFGRIVAENILTSVHTVSTDVKKAVIELMTAKTLPADDVLRPLKLLIDSEVDADRIDSTARDGMLAGGEYGSYDIERLCSSFRIVRDKAASGSASPKWSLGYSRKALSSLEGLLLDRYRAHRWIHYHHRVVAMKCAMRVLIAKLLGEASDEIKNMLIANGVVGADAWQFDDVWLLSQLRKKKGTWTSEPEKSALAAVLHRDMTGVHLLWKDRLEWDDTWKAITKVATGRLDIVNLKRFGRVYETGIDTAFRNERSRAHFSMRIYVLGFKPLDDRKLPLVGNSADDAKPDLKDRSPISAGLKEAWQAEPQLYMVVFGDLNLEPEERKKELARIRKWWEDHTAAWLSEFEGDGDAVGVPNT
jgi:HD superfamily phosphohydrolase